MSARKESADQDRQPLFTWNASKQAAAVALRRMNPMHLRESPVMLTVMAGALVCLVFTVRSLVQGNPFLYELAITLLLLATLYFGNFAEAIAEARGQAQASSLRAARSDTPARRRTRQGVEEVASTALRKGDVVIVEAGEIVPGDGEILEGIATIDESAITGESAPVLREAGSDRSTVTGGTRVLSDRIVVEISANPGDSFLDRMISLIEGAARQRTPNELALGALLTTLTAVFVVVVATLPALGTEVGLTFSPVLLVALLVCLIPTTIGGLLPAIGVAGMDRALRANVIAKSGKAVEVAGDIDTLLLDKTGTLTYGDRRATAVHPLAGHTEDALLLAAAVASLSDTTPEGKSIVTLARERGLAVEELPAEAESIAFTAQTRMSGVDMPDGRSIRKGASDRMLAHLTRQGTAIPARLTQLVQEVASRGATPLVVTEGARALGVVELSDVIKPGMRERFDRLRAMGLKSVMVTGDNPLTAAAIAAAVGVDDFVAEARPEDKLALIRREQAQGRLVAMMGDGTNDAPALAQADVGLAMNAGTQAAKEAANMIDLDSNPTKLVEVIEIGKQLLVTRGSLTTFSIANDVAKYFAILPALMVPTFPALAVLDIMQLTSPQSAVLSAVIFNALIIPALIPLALRGATFRPLNADALLARNLVVYGGGGLVAPFLGIKAIDLLLAAVGLA